MTISDNIQEPLSSEIEILPETRRHQLSELGLATFHNSSITYLRLDYTDNLSDAEEQVRADLYLDLVNDYGYSRDQAIVMEKYYKIGHPHKKSDAKLDMLIRYPDGRPFMLIELKSPSEYETYLESSIRTQLYNVAAVENQGQHSIQFLLFYTRYWEEGILQEKLVCIDYTKYPSFEEWDLAGRPNLRAIPLDYGIVRVPRFIKGGEPDLRTNVRRDELQRIRRDLHNILWGGGKYQNELFFNLVGLFLVKIYDEKETDEREPYAFQIFFEDGEPEAADSVYTRMNTIYLKALNEYLGYSEEDLQKVRDIVFDAQKVRYVVEVLQGISFTANKFDVIGEFFEGVVRGEFKQSKGQYLTHTNLIRFMVQGLELGELAIKLINEEKRLPIIIDPSCGSGAFLIESMRHITSSVLSQPLRLKKSNAVRESVSAMFPEYRLNSWAKHNIYGIEINGDLAMATKVNMVGHGDGAANIEARDALIPFQNFKLGILQISKVSNVYPKPVNEQFDVILSNPPFSVTVDRDTARTFPDSYLQGDGIIRTLKKSGEAEVATELLFIERYFQLLRPHGRLAVVLPESVFDTNSTIHTRLFLFRHFRVLGIISLPIEAFAPYTTTKTTILFAEKKTDAEIRAWNDDWNTAHTKYQQLKSELATYLAVPPFIKAVEDIVDRYEEAIGLQFDAEVALDVSEAAATFAVANKDQSDLADKVTDLLVSYFEDMTQEQQDILRDIIKRKKSFARTVGAYVDIVKSQDKFVELLRTLLGSLFDESHVARPIEALVEEYREEIRNADEDWWIYKQVSAKLGDYNMLLAQADEIGYKRGVRGEEDKPNELYQVDGDVINIDAKEPATILDHLIATIKWSV